jgi:hypothetical protein
MAETRLINAALNLARTIRGKEKFPRAFELAEEAVFDGSDWLPLGVDDMQIARAAARSYTVE